MLRMTPSTSASRAQSYYSTADYYAEGQELAGLWRGTGAAMLGLVGTIERGEWDRLCENRHPFTCEALTPRLRDDRRVGYDFNFHAPKSLSVLYGLTRDERLLDAFRASFRETMDAMEAEMRTRVRAGGANADRTTSNMVYGEFTHFTARPVDGVPDPHLHSHCFVFNTTYDPQEHRWKAGQFGELKHDAPYFEAVFHSHLARRMVELGVPIQRTRTGWELLGTPQSVIEKFSRRTEQIEKEAKARNITDPDAKSELGAKTRERKQKSLTLDELREQWRQRMTGEERAALDGLAAKVGPASLPELPEVGRESIEQAISQSFERRSVVEERRVQALALKRAVGAMGPRSLLTQWNGVSLIRGERNGRKVVSTPAVLAEERAIIEFGREGRGTCRPFVEGEVRFNRDWLNDEQKRAVAHVLSSRDRIVLVRGGAGVGKTTALKEIAEAIEERGKKVIAVAPSADASRGVLRTEGFAQADTVARLLVDLRLQERARGNVILVDEAGLLGTKTMRELFDLAGTLQSRVILSGDRRQHASVERGSALRLLETEAGLVSAQIKTIQRQKDAYKRAVEALSEGRTADGFQRLDDLGWITQIGDTQQREAAIAEEYVKSIKEVDKVLVIAPTHIEGDRITQAIRSRLKASGVLGPSRTVATLRNLHLTQAERADSVNLLPGDVVIFTQNARGHQKGERLTVGRNTIPLDLAPRYQVFRPGTLDLAKGDILRVTQNGLTKDGAHRLDNGARYTVAGFTRTGDVQLSNGWVVDRDWGHLAHGYVSTSHAAQGRTVDRVIIAESEVSLPAASPEQFYVSVSRGRQSARIFTDSTHALLDAVTRQDERMSATELAQERDTREIAAALRRHAAQHIERAAERILTPDRERHDHDRTAH